MFKLLKEILKKLEYLITEIKDLKSEIKSNRIECEQYHSQQCAHCIHRNNNTFYDDSTVYRIGPSNIEENFHKTMKKEMKEFYNSLKY